MPQNRYMKNSVETLKALLNSIDDELARIIQSHQSAKSYLVGFARTSLDPKTEMSWIVAKFFLEIVNMLGDNLDSLNKMHSVLLRLKIKVFLFQIIGIFAKNEPFIPNLEYFSDLLNRVIANLEKVLDEIKSSLLSPVLKTNPEVAPPFILALDSPINDIRNSMQTAQNIVELLSKIRFYGQEKPTSLLSDLENTIYNALLKTVPSAAATYQQAIIDLSDQNRMSYRGVANEFRETLRETLDFFAPENMVISQPNFRFENGKTNSTMKQRVRYILKSRGAISNALRTPEDAIEIIEDRIASFTRATYERSSISVHIAAERREVQQIKHYTNAVLVELLRIGFDNDTGR